ncbi:DNA cytosine methyltransferase [Marinobacter sp. RI1]|uniref:DNA cytosine methyltransferase n=1 Tax=Marinobacter sp. RI1 TaxID=3158171 RepID=UPI0034E8BD27
MTSTNPTVVSLFSGCGGLDLGFKQSGFELVYAADSDKASIDIYRRNLDENAFVRDVTTEEFHSDIRAVRRCDVVLGGFPCQGFSKAGPKRHNDERNTLYQEMRSAIKALEPEVFIAENVDGMKQNFSGKFVQSIIEDFSSLGYDVDVQILNALAYGVPQHRRRIFFVGTRKAGSRHFPWPKATHHAPVRNGEFSIPQSGLFGGTEETVLLDTPTIRDAIGDLLELGKLPDHLIDHSWPKKYDHIIRKIGEGQKLCNVRHSPTSVYTWEIPEAFGEISERQLKILECISRNRRLKKYGSIPNGNPLPIDEISRLTQVEPSADEIQDLLSKGYLKEKNGGFDLKGAMFCSGLFKRPLWDAPSPTILTNFHNPRYFLHPEENRPFSLRECARLQSFPDGFLFNSESSPRALIAGYRLVGNAVPPKLSFQFAQKVKAYLQETNAKAA